MGLFDSGGEGIQAAVDASGSNTPQASPGGIWAGPTNTGYTNAPGYRGSLATGPSSLTPNTTYSFMTFPGGVNVNVANVTFYGCLFPTTDPDQANCNMVTGGNATFNYCTFKPATVSSPRPGGGVNFSDSYQYAIDQNPGAGQLIMTNCDCWGFGEAIQISDPSGSSATQPMTLSGNWIHDASDQGTGSGQYHVDGFLCNNGGISHLTVNHNTIVGPYDTNALALQSSDGTTLYTNITVTNNYFSGYGFMVNIGGHTHSTGLVVTGNVWADDYEPGFGPLYGTDAWDTAGLGNTWSNNKYWAKLGTWMSRQNDGLFWWPDDVNPASPSSIIGHAVDYTNH